MRLTIIIILIAVFQLSAKNTRGQKLTYSKDNTTISQIFKEIKRQTGYNVVWYEGKLNSHEPIDVNFYNTPLDKVMDNVLDGRAVTYQIIGKAIVVKAGAPSFRATVTSTLATIDVRGRVLDENNEPLVGATVKIKGSTNSTVTNANGEFRLQNVNTKDILVISFVGYDSKEIKASENLENVQLALSTDKLQEVEINAGYYTVTDRERTGNISRVTAETISKQPVNNPLLALQNRVPGLVITQQTGMQGGSVSVQIRGRSSINTIVGNDPLYIIDGVVYPSTRVSPSNLSTTIGLTGISPLSMINPNDIESIEILKDADATAIYGSRGANGVILIKTKKGGTGDIKINAGITQGFSKVDRRLNLLNTEQYLQMRREAFTNDATTPTTTDYDLNGAWDQNKYTDWQKNLIGGTARSTNASLNLSGGTEKINYFATGNYYQEGTVFAGDFGFKRAGMQSSATLGSSKDRFNITLTANYNHIQNNLVSGDPTKFIFLAPNAPDPYDENGKLNWSNNTVYQNPMAGLSSLNKVETDNLIANLLLNYRIVNNLYFKTSIGYSNIKGSSISTRPFESYSPALNPTALSRQSNFSNFFNNTIMAEPQITYKTKLGFGNFDALIGLSFQSNDSEIRTIRATGFTSDALMENITSASTLSITQMSFIPYRYTAIFARLNYSLRDKYILNFTARRDGSSRFGEGKQFANFGAIGTAWIFSEEKFIKATLPFVSFGKLRASYGTTGNDQIPDYGYLQLWNSSSGTYQGAPTISPISDRIGNPDFAWEINRKMEFALQLGLINNKINLEASWYNNRSSNQLIGDPLPLSTGNRLMTANRSATVQNTGWEFDANFKIFNKPGWSWSTGINLTIPRNKLVSYPGIESSPDFYNYIVGKPLSIRRIYNVKGVDSQSGLYDIEDKNGNGILDDTDRYQYKFTGIYFYGGFQNSLQFKQFNLEFLFAFTKQNSTNNYLNGSFSPGYWDSGLPTTNLPLIALSRWQKPGDQTSIQKASTTILSVQRYNQARINGGESIGDASFVRLKNIAFSYNLPKAFLSRLKIIAAKISLQGQNIFTISNYVGLDPETQSMQNLPPLQTVAIGLNLTL